jgi:mono/diheme cytochrome c family protein
MKFNSRGNRVYLMALTSTALVGWLVVFTVYLAQAAPMAQTAIQGQAIFEQKCQGCHTIGHGVLVGPDLQGVTTRRDRQWLVNFISAPDKVLAAGDPIATKLRSEHNNISMPNLGLSATEVEAVLAFLETQTGSGQAQTQPQAVSLPTGDVERGRQLFAGQVALANGGPACMGCHNAGGVGQLGGGSLGPDLTQVYSRLGQAGLASALNTIPFPTMQGVFANQSLTPQEQADLLAFFAWADQAGAAQPAAAFNAWFWLAGFGGVFVLFAGLALFWPRQRRSFSEALRSKA